MTKSSHPLALWLFICCGMVFVTAVIGAITRLTESGLSITDWAPVTGTLPPLNNIEWHKAFSAYKKIPQYQLHTGMTLDEFKGIYFWEWLHRFWDRLIGLVFALPLLWFIARRKIDKPLAIRLAAILALGALQGFIGWYMVQSGLSVRTSVSQYRLALHLFMALLVYALMLWMALDLYGTQRTPSTWCLRRHGWVSLGFLIITMIWGAFTAGLHAGAIFNTWPMMEDEFMPSLSFIMLPKWQNAFANPAFVQFIHRWLGPTTALIILSWVIRLLRKEDISKAWPLALAIMALLQVALGITTVLMHADIAIAALHQAGAITLLTLLLLNLYRLRKN